MSYIQLIKGKNKKNLDILISFYNNVWGGYAEYVDYDKALYCMFKKDNEGNFSKMAKVVVLNKMYSAGMKDVQLESFVKDFDWVISGRQYKKYGGDYKSNQLLSLESKLCHWNNEVNDKSKTSPIYDNNVRVVISHYTGVSKSSMNGNFKDTKKAVDDFITKYLGGDIKDPITVTVEGLPSEISIYRLVDKFLWLSYKIIKNGRMVPEDVKKQFNAI